MGDVCADAAGLYDGDLYGLSVLGTAPSGFMQIISTFSLYYIYMIAEEYTKRREAILERVQELCWDPACRMYREGPAFGQFYQFTQSWAVLNGMLAGEEAAALMERSFDAEKVLQCNSSTCYELFRACEKAGCYKLTVRQMQKWIDLIGENCTTCPETPQDSRSECHAWSALPMYEMVCSLAGIKADIQRDAVLEICPHMEYLPDIKGDVVTDRGTIHFDYRKEEGHVSYELWIPDGVTGIFRHPDGTAQQLVTGKNIIDGEMICRRFQRQLISLDLTATIVWWIVQMKHC